MSKFWYRIEHTNNITTGICESCESYGIITLEKFYGQNIYVCSICLDWLEKEIFGVYDWAGTFNEWRYTK